MQANKLQALTIIIKSVLITLWISIAAIYRSYRGLESRLYCDQLLHWWAHNLLRFVRLSCRAYNPHDVRFEKNRAYIIMSNHSSLYDIPLTFAAIPGSIRMLAKRELFTVPIWGRGLKASEFVSIDRDNRRQALKDLDEARKKMESGIVLWVAPEGTRSSTGRLGEFKKGGFMLALRTGATIIPIGIRGAFEVLPSRTLNFHLGRHAEIHVGKPIDASRFTNRTRNQLMEEVEAQIRKLAALPKGAA